MLILFQSVAESYTGQLCADGTLNAIKDGFKKVISTSSPKYVLPSRTSSIIKITGRLKDTPKNGLIAFLLNPILGRGESRGEEPLSLARRTGQRSPVT